MNAAEPAPPSPDAPSSWLPAIGSTRYHILLGTVAIFILGPLGGITAAYMNFSLGFFVGGQVLAGILGSAVTYGYGAEGKHGANYMQTMAASVASMSGMAVLVQAAMWLGIPQPPAWQLMLYFGSIGMFGVGVGMLYTPILVDRMNLVFPSGFAVANILRALTDKKLLQASIGKLGSGTLIGFVGGIGSTLLASLSNLGLSTSTIGAGMVVGARIAVPGMVVGLIGEEISPWLREIGWLAAGAPFRKIGFVIALGTILGAAMVDLSMLAGKAVRTFRESAAKPPEAEWKRTNTTRLWLWIVGWAAAVIGIGTGVLHLPATFVIIAVGLVFVFLMINGISLGISDSNPISSAFVISVFVMAAAGLVDPGVGLLCAAILLIATSVGCDMQQDRSTGARLGTNRILQFRYQVIGVTMGAVMAVLLAHVFIAAYPVLQVDQYTNPNTPGAEKWQSAMTFKFVGALQGLTHPNPHFTKALGIGIGIGLVTEILRKIIKGLARYRAFVASGKIGFATDFVLDAFLLPSPYASSFGGFVDFTTTVWFAMGGILSSFGQTLQEEVASTRTDDAVPDDMSTTSLVGGGLIAGDSLAALGIGIVGLLATFFG